MQENLFLKDNKKLATEAVEYIFLSETRVSVQLFCITGISLGNDPKCEDQLFCSFP